LKPKKWSLKLEKVLLYGRLLPSARPILGRGVRKLLPSEKFSAVSPGYTGDECVFSDYKKKNKKSERKKRKTRFKSREVVETRTFWCPPDYYQRW